MTRPAKLLTLSAICLAFAAGERDAVVAAVVEEMTMNFRSIEIRPHSIDPKARVAPARKHAAKLRVAKPRVQRKRVRIQRRAR